MATSNENTDKKKNTTKSGKGSKRDSKGFLPIPMRDTGPTRPWYKNPLILLVVLFVLTGIIGKFLTLDNKKNEVDFGTFISRVEKKDFEKVEVEQTIAKIIPKDKNENPVTTNITNQEDFRRALSEVGVDAKTTGIDYKHPSNIDILSIISTLSLLIFIGVIGFSFFSAKNMANGGPMMGFGDSKAKLFVGRRQDIRFDQIQGADEAVEDVKEIVSFLKTPDKYIKLGARIPKGVLLVGQPGTGKTLMARAIAGEAGVPFFFTSGSEFEEMLVGTGASRVRDLFAKAKKAAPSIIFIDEVDSIARKRGTVLNSGNTEQTLNQILVEMDGFDKNTNVIVIAATNRPDVLDPAIMRPGRFDRRVLLELPDVKGREEILKVHSKNKPLSKDVVLGTVAKRTIGFSGADLENTLNESAIIAAKDGRSEIGMKDIEEAATKVTIGPAKKRAKSDRQKKLAAYHEAGHAIAGYYVEGADKVHRISIVSRGYTGGVTMYLPEEDDMEMRTEAKFKGELITLFGGRSAEKIALDSVSTGASSDIRRATQIARDMVKKYGMSSLGYIDLEQETEYYQQPNPYSEKTAEEIDKAVSQLLAEAQKKSEEILIAHRDQLNRLADVLVENEVVESDEFYEFMKAVA
jgi:cell division protease FtsH